MLPGWDKTGTLLKKLAYKDGRVFEALLPHGMCGV